MPDPGRGVIWCQGSTIAWAEGKDYPNKPIRVMVPYDPGGIVGLLPYTKSGEARVLTVSDAVPDSSPECFNALLAK